MSLFAHITSYEVAFVVAVYLSGVASGYIFSRIRGSLTSSNRDERP